MKVFVAILLVVCAEAIAVHGFLTSWRASGGAEVDGSATGGANATVSTESGLQYVVSSALNRTWMPPGCVSNGTQARCCQSVPVNMDVFRNNPVCVSLNFDLNHLTVVGSFEAFNRTVLSKNIVKADRFCAPLPPPGAALGLTGCLQAYYVDLDPRDPSAEVCLAASINNIARLQFDCFRMSRTDGLSIQAGRQPQDEALVNLNVNKGRPHVSFGTPSVGQFLPQFGFGLMG